MQNIRYNLIHLSAVVFFAYICAFTVNSIVRKIFQPAARPVLIQTGSQFSSSDGKRPVDINAIINSNFFKLASADPSVSSNQQQDTGNLILLGTIAGNSSFARALIKNRTETISRVYALGDNVFGMKLVRVESTEVFLKSGSSTQKLSLADKNDGSAANQSVQQGNNIKKVLSRSEFQQKIRNNMDTMLQGLRAGPYTVNGKIEGYKLFALSNDNFLYTIGARGGDIIKRINGHPIDSTETLYKIWSNIGQESRVILDIEREGKTVTFDYTFNE